MTPAPGAPKRGPGPPQAAISSSSPLRNRWQRTPPVARPLAGYSANGVTLTDAPPVPGSAPERPATVTTTNPASPGPGRLAALAAGPIAPNQTTLAPSSSRM